MKDNKNAVIAVLCVAAAILLTILVLGQSAGPAYANSSVRGGDYIMVNGSVTNNTDAVYIIDVPQQKVNVYVVQNDGSLALMDQLGLKQLFTAK